MLKGLIVKFLLLVIIGAGLGAIAQSIIFPEKVSVLPLRQSGWSLLNDNERKTLQPLADKWEAMDSLQQEKWRAIAKKYPSFSQREQQKLQRRMARWADVEPEQRAVARKKYKSYKKKKPEEQERLRSVWQSHQKIKEKDNTASRPNANESPTRDGAEAKETESTPAFEQPSPSPITEGLRSESQ
jgi:hypothetical protein